MAQKITFEEFQASGVDCADIGAHLKDECLQGVAGRIYLGVLYIERWDDPRGPWLTLIGREEPSGSLETVERALYEFAEGEGYCDTTGQEK
jgi:ABC-type phosphate transport system substrate-binding protein